MPANKRKRAPAKRTPAKASTKPAADSIEVNADGTVDLRIKGEMVYLRCPTVGEVEKIVLGHAALVKRLSEIGKQLAEYQKVAMAHAVATAEALQAGSEPPEAPEGMLSEEDATGLVFSQWHDVAGFWATEIIPMLTDGTHEVLPQDLPSVFSRPESVSRAVGGWYGLP